MRALHVIINGEIMGGQIVCLQIIEALVQQGHEALVVSSSEGPFTTLLRKKRISVFFLPFEKTYSFHRAFQLARLIKRERVDLVHTHGMVPLNIHARLAARLTGTPCISHIHIANVFNHHPFVRKYQVFLDNWTSSFCYKLIAVSKATKESLVEQGIPPYRIQVIPNSIDHSKVICRSTREEVFQRLHIDPRNRLVGMIGRLCPAKGQEDFLKAAKLVAKQMPDVVWILVGKDIEFCGAYERRLKDLSQSLDLNGRVIFTGHQDDPFSLLNAMEFLVLPSKAEGMPLVILEAMSLKKAVIATAVGGIPEVIQDGENGILISPGDCEMLARAITNLLTKSSLTRTMGQRGFDKVRENHSNPENIRRIIEIYQQLNREKI